MLTAGVACYRAWIAAGGPATSVMAGHSLGEYGALVASGVIEFKDAVPMVRFRAQAMQDAVPVGTGGMAAILGLDDDAVRKACADAQSVTGEVVEAVNYNAPAQVVIAGSKAGVEKACELAKEAGAKRALPLPVSAPFHSSLLKPASEKLETYLKDKTFKVPSIDVINNVDVTVLKDPAAIKNALVRQAAAPVRWVETVQAIAALGITHVVECGPGKVLTGMTKRINGDLNGLAVYDPATMAEVMTVIKA
jgi:[acyl-carrier-protein] S-malonyltransferase